MNTRDSHTHFGFRTVSESEKAPMVRHVFDSVSDRYDLMNDLMSVGVHRLWKRTMVNRLAPRGSMDILDLAGGTGDIALRILGKSGNGVSVTVCDINQSMLDVGRDRALNLGRTDGLRWLCADAENLPIPDRAMDAVTMAFGIRNVTRIDRALREIRRVLKPGGRFLCLEFSHLNLPLLDTLYERFSFDLLPRLGAAVTGDGEAYRYLVESIRKFPDQEAFAAMIGEAGLGQVTHRNLSGGIAALHSAWRL